MTAGNTPNETTVYEQDMGPMKQEDQGLFSASMLTKIVPALFFVGVLLWNGYAYLQGKQADAFIEIYNPNIASISSNMGTVESNFLEIGNSFNKLGDITEDNLEETQEIVKKSEEIITSNAALFNKIKEKVAIIESQACPKLKHSKQQCIEFIVGYRDMILAFEGEQYDRANEIALSTVKKSEIFVLAAKKDNIEF